MFNKGFTQKAKVFVPISQSSYSHFLHIKFLENIWNLHCLQIVNIHYPKAQFDPSCFYFFFIFLVLGCYNEGHIIFSTRTSCNMHSFCKWCYFKCHTSSAWFFWWYIDIWGSASNPFFHDLVYLLSCFVLIEEFFIFIGWIC